MNRALSLIRHALDLPAALAQYVVGKDHKLSHRMVAGFVVGAAGVGIVHCAPFCHESIAFAVETLGTVVNALGVTPYVEAFAAVE